VVQWKNMQSYLMITLRPIVRELASLQNIFLDYIDANEDENAEIFLTAKTLKMLVDMHFSTMCDER
jgi:hypothetical protein